MENKIFLVVACSYDGTSNVIGFNNKDEAEKYVIKYDRVIGKLSELISTCWNVICEDDDLMTNDRNNFYYKIWAKYHIKFGDFEYCRIEEIKLK